MNIGNMKTQAMIMAISALLSGYSYDNGLQGTSVAMAFITASAFIALFLGYLGGNHLKRGG